MNADKEIKKLEKKLAALRAKSAKAQAGRKKTALRRAIIAIKKFGYNSLHELLEIADTAAVATRTGKRAKITAAIKKSVVAMLKTGETVAATAKKHAISAPSVNNIKKAAGLTKPKKSKVVKVHPLGGRAAGLAKSKKIHAVKAPKIPSKKVAKKIYGPKGVVAVAEVPVAPAP